MRRNYTTLATTAVCWVFQFSFGIQNLRLVDSFSTSNAIVKRQGKSSKLRRHVSNNGDPDFVEMMLGGERYEMVPLPDSMVDTTLFVGNLCEFVKDDDLSNLFQAASKLHYVPACVVRKANTDSLGYGFVTFPNVEEKTRALIKFANYELNGRPLRVECIEDKPNAKRVRIPERMVAYTCGEAKKTGDGRVNTLRRVSTGEVDRLSKGQSMSKRKAFSKKPTISMRVNDSEQEELGRASRKGYLTLLSTAFRRGRRNSALANVHREWCDSRGKVQIILCKASGGRRLDSVIIDLSPLRVHGIVTNSKEANSRLLSFKSKILEEAEEAGMKLLCNALEDNTIQVDENVFEGNKDSTLTLENKSWASEPIWSLPSISVGVFEGERASAKRMAKAMAEMWEIPEKHCKGVADIRPTSKRNSQQRRRGLSEHRRRARNPHYLFD
mmetsp:Transcript_17468/g.25823  ORF Transcript_17468/g.25823 Transcript_17468/m.25823 type:complete len:440 (+) Transcript_17468:205-1524(+)|eukprot:CAMPEP_0194211454 /NCGR_PEP_ID=MMETSP0156-20130528/10294_1 /TAXON_ID=33649 /ORGANISM="Thalassionema nitzschioides, Strain L26-B" /LENGTH=439 /DNA_ID=CAMNT_0038938999 /DNA_START=137 /DNA_END=1456 /DNA_ORIENTATION=+